MNLRKISTVFAVSMLLSGCCMGPNCQVADNTTYGVEDSKWAVMSHDQRQSAKEVYKLDQTRQAEQNKLNVLHEQKSAANEQRNIQRKNELERIDHENAVIRDQQRKVGSITEQEQLRQQQREQDLDNLKG